MNRRGFLAGMLAACAAPAIVQAANIMRVAPVVAPVVVPRQSLWKGEMGVWNSVRITERVPVNSVRITERVPVNSVRITERVPVNSVRITERVPVNSVRITERVPVTGMDRDESYYVWCMEPDYAQEISGEIGRVHGFSVYPGLSEKRQQIIAASMRGEPFARLFDKLLRA
jgi:hypothetical protein